MHYYFTAVSLIAGVCLGFGILYLFIGLRRQDNRPLYLTFALFALCYATTLVNGIRWYSTDKITEFVAINRLDSMVVAGAFVALVWFVSYYASFRPRILLWVLSAVLVAPSLVFIISPVTFFGEVSGLNYIILPWGEKLADLDSAGSVWLDIHLFARLLALGYIVLALVRQFRRGERQPAIALGLGMLPFIAGIFYEVLGESGFVPYIPFGEFGFLGIAIAASLQMSNQVIRTEEELGRYRYRLEGLVDERMSELQRANEQLGREIAERAQAEETLRQRVGELAALSRIAQAVTTVVDLATVLEQVGEMVTDLFEARYAHVIWPTAPESGLFYVVGFGRESGPTGPTPLNVPLGEMPAVQNVLATGESLTLKDVQSLPLADPVRAFLAAQNVQNVVIIPLLVRGKPIGIMSVATDQPGRAFTPDGLSLLGTVASDVAAAIENARLLEQAQAAAVTEERRRIARDLHDAVTQTVYAAGLITEALPRVWERSPAEGQRNLAKLRQLVRGALAELRSLLFELRPAALEEARLDVLLRQLGDALTGRARVPVEVSVDGEVTLPSEVKVALYRITQEAFNNIAKHAEATQALVRLRSDPDRILLTIRDDGRGFDPAWIPPERMGVRIMRERAEGVGAELTLESEPGQGTEVQVVWSIDDRRASHDPADAERGTGRELHGAGSATDETI